MLLKTQIEAAAKFLIDRRNSPENRIRLAAELRPTTVDEAIRIQQTSVAGLGNTIGGWKCVLPTVDKLNVAPIIAKTIYGKSPCPIRLEKGICRIEPEIAFCFKQDLPPRNTAYSDAEIRQAIGSTHMALELIENRNAISEDVSYLENMADCLFNQGMFLGPEIPFDKACKADELDFVLTQHSVKTFKGKHPNQGPILPVLWLANFLRERGMGIRAGHAVITGSFAGVHEVQPNHEFTIEYTGLGKMAVSFSPM